MTFKVMKLDELSTENVKREKRKGPILDTRIYQCLAVEQRRRKNQRTEKR